MMMMISQTLSLFLFYFFVLFNLQLRISKDEAASGSEEGEATYTVDVLLGKRCASCEMACARVCSVVQAVRDGVSCDAKFVFPLASVLLIVNVVFGCCRATGTMLP